MVAVASMAASAVVARHSMMVVSAAVVVDSMIAISGAAASDSDSATRIMTPMTTTPTLIRIGIDMATHTPQAMGTKTTAVAM